MFDGLPLAETAEGLAGSFRASPCRVTFLGHFHRWLAATPEEAVPFLKDRLKLTKEQEKQIANLERDVRDRLNKILTAEQKKQFEDLRRGIPGGPGFLRLPRTGADCWIEDRSRAARRQR